MAYGHDAAAFLVTCRAALDDTIKELRTTDKHCIEKMFDNLVTAISVELDLVEAGTYTHTEATFIASCKAAIIHDINAMNNLTDRKVMHDMMTSFVTAIAAEFEVVDQT